jgi:hypothetical protein
MALQYGTAVKIARLNALETTVGTSPKLQIRTGAPPAGPATADSGTLLCEITLPSNWLADAGAVGEVVTKVLAGSWTGTAVATDTAGHFRLKDSAGTTTHAQGTVTASGGGGDAIIESTSVVSGQTVTVTAFTLTAGN